MNKNLSILLCFTVLLGCAFAIEFNGGALCGHCGNNQLEVSVGETCDDGNTADLDGCNSQCQIEVGYTCVVSGLRSVCTLITVNPSCGNNVRNPNEECDDGNRVSGDGCTSNCFVEPGHRCVDPSASEPDKCTYENINACGNGILELNNHETCDDGNRNPGDGCGVHCVVQTHYVCTTQGNSVSTCVTTSVCGNNIRQANQQCDNGLGAGCQDCTLDPEYYCTLNQFCRESLCYRNTICGDGIRQGSEACDAGVGSPACVNCQVVSGYVCVEDTFKFSVCSLIPVCGNFLKEVGEECDNGNNAGCQAGCKIDPNYSCETSPLGASICYLCGNGIVQLQQVCDNGNKPGCSKNCVVDAGYYCSTQPNGASLCVVSVCGNGIREPLEECDNGNKQGCYSCLVSMGYTCYEDPNNFSVCRLTNCGNGIREGSQECDNFNAIGCFNCMVEIGYQCQQDSLKRSTCTLIPVCGNAGREAGQECDNGNQLGCLNCKVDPGYSCVENALRYSLCTRNPYCGDSIRQANEECDNGDILGCKGCKVDPGFICITLPNGFSVCQPTVCGNGIKEGSEQCDNGAKQGCKLCKVEAGWQCANQGTGSVCTKIPTCGDGIRQASHEQCDNGNKTGCINCKVDSGYTCDEDIHGLSMCYKSQCGNSIVEDGEQCDNGNRMGCMGCVINQGWSCVTNVAGSSVCTVTSVCGNNRRENNEECDNGNQAGCLGCTVDFGYQCQEGIRNQSICTKATCGDRIKQQGEECDNGKKEGCPECRVASGYQCSQINGQISVCNFVPTCGNKVTEAGQQCDNGNTTGCIGCKIDPGYVCTGQTCTPVPATCNNFIKQIGEECDNGGYDGCSNNCKITPGWACVGNFLSASTCSKIAACGDNALQPILLEQCDDGNTNNNDGCSSKCKVQRGWSCPSRGLGVPTVCVRIIADGCGDHVFDPSLESCDDGNNINGDGCSKYCFIEPGYSCQVRGTLSVCALSTIPVGCGDSIVDYAAGEQCDDNNNVSYDGCDKACHIEWGWQCYEVSTNRYSKCSKKCGNGYYEPFYREWCDDGNNYNNDGCNAFCEIEDGYYCSPNTAGQKSKCYKKPPIVCGNGKVQQNEECDDGYAHSGDGCSSTCKVQAGWQCGGNPSYCFYKPVCGNAVVQTGQFCDDGNSYSGDGCTSNCRIQDGYTCYSLVPQGISICEKKTTSVCGNGIKEYGEQCDDGNNNKYDGCDNCRIVTYPPPPPVEFCGDAKYQPSNGEECDNGNTTGCYNCKEQYGYTCVNKINQISVCTKDTYPPIPPPQNFCGNGRFEPNAFEQCDDGNNNNNDGCSSACHKEPGYICFNQIAVQSLCYYPYVCQFTNYVVPFIKLCPQALKALQGTSLSNARTVLDIIKQLIRYDATNALINKHVLAQMDNLIYNGDSTEWSIIAYNINACTGYTTL